MHVHLVFVAKYRRRVFDGDAINRLRTIFAKTCEDFEAQLIEMDGEDDHVHLAWNIHSGRLQPREQPPGQSSSRRLAGAPRHPETLRRAYVVAVLRSLIQAVRRFPSCASTSNSSR